MNIKKYVGKDMRKLLEEIRREMGENAVILHTRTYKKRGFLFWRAEQIVEITASDDVKVADVKLPPRPVPRKKTAQAYAKNRIRSDYSPDENQRRASVNNDLIKKEAVLFDEIREIKQIAYKLLDKGQFSVSFPGAYHDFYAMLLGQQISSELAEELVDQILSECGKDADWPLIRMHAMRKIESFIRPRPIGLPVERPLPYKIALVGPTGVGKTTTIAKLSAKFSLIEKRKVGLVTVDTFRIAAVDQLKTYADIMKLPLEVIVSPNDVASAFGSLRNREIVFVDTAGRSQKNDMQMSELSAFLSAIQPDEVHLVLSATSHPKNILDVIDKFKEIKVDRLLFTKLDETPSFGVILEAVEHSGLPVSYLTTGQSVPDDIEEAKPFHIAELICQETGEYARSGSKTS